MIGPPWPLPSNSHLLPTDVPALSPKVGTGACQAPPPPRSKRSLLLYALPAPLPWMAPWATPQGCWSTPPPPNLPLEGTTTLQLQPRSSLQLALLIVSFLGVKSLSSSSQVLSMAPQTPQASLGPPPFQTSSSATRPHSGSNCPGSPSLPAFIPHSPFPGEGPSCSLIACSSFRAQPPVISPGKAHLLPHSPHICLL